MPVFIPPRFRTLLSGLVGAVLLCGAAGSLRMSPTLLTLVVLMALALEWMRRERGLAWALPSGPREWREEVPAFVLARSASREKEQSPSSGSYPVPRKIVDFPVRRSFGSRVKLWVGSVGLALLGVWWMLLVTILFFPDPGARDSLYLNTNLTLITVTLLLTVLFLVILRSGLRGPADPLAPENHHGEELRDLPLGDGQGPAPRTPSGSGRKSHLRLVRPSL
ncbi:hypothetical protein [Archangium lipolyticum]|uniref:hypothetical protein n=1 Tax=Archangium lipolyticum TaxID=2970465 RepID=UPI002149E9C7|nr:hypothetical protein [Archangium lipolyticum]